MALWEGSAEFVIEDFGQMLSELDMLDLVLADWDVCCSVTRKYGSVDFAVDQLMRAVIYLLVNHNIGRLQNWIHEQAQRNILQLLRFFFVLWQMRQSGHCC